MKGSKSFPRIDSGIPRPLSETLICNPPSTSQGLRPCHRAHAGRRAAIGSETREGEREDGRDDGGRDRDTENRPAGPPRGSGGRSLLDDTVAGASFLAAGPPGEAVATDDGSAMAVIEPVAAGGQLRQAADRDRWPFPRCPPGWRAGCGWSRPGLRRRAARRAGTGQCTPVAQPRRSKTRITAAEMSTWPGSAPCRAQAGSEWCMLCQLSPNDTRASGHRLVARSWRRVAKGRLPKTWHSELTLQVTCCSTATRTRPAHSSAASAACQVPPISHPAANGSARETAHRTGNAARDHPHGGVGQHVGRVARGRGWGRHAAASLRGRGPGRGAGRPRWCRSDRGSAGRRAGR